MGSATSNTRGLESTMHAKNAPPTAPPSPSPPQEAGPAPADNLLEARRRQWCGVLVENHQPLLARALRLLQPLMVWKLWVLKSRHWHRRRRRRRGPPSRRRNWRNRRELAAGSTVELPEADDTSRGNKRQMVVHYVFPEWSAGSSVQVKIEYAADHVVATAPALLTCSICLNELEEPSVTTCGHVFCDRCVKQAVRINKACPNCRNKLCRSSIRRVYLPTPACC